MILLFLSPHAQAVEVGASFPLAIRTGMPGCWVKRPIENGLICIPKNLWLRDFESTGSWEGRWSISSPPDNDGSPKKTIRLFHASKKLAPSPEQSFLASVGTFIERRREETSQKITDQFSDHYGILKRLLLNESGPEDFSPFLRILGFVHLFSASGIHLYALSVWTGWAISILGNQLSIPLAVALVASRFLSFSLWTWGWALTGFKLSLLRPLLLIAIRRLATLTGFRWRTWTPLALSLGLDLFFAKIISGADWAQGAAFYSLAIAGGALADGHILVSLSSWVFLGIWDALKSAHIALLTPLLSLLTLSATTLVIYPFLIMVSVWPSFTTGKIICDVFEVWIKLLIQFSLFPGNLWIVKPSLVSLAILAVAFCSVFKKSYRAPLGLVSMGAFVMLRFLPHDARMIQIDVGQGDGALYAARKSGLVDTGSKHSLSDVAWIELFAREGVTEISWIGLTHLDEDHSGGALRISRLVPIACVATSDNELLTARGVVFEDMLKASRVEVDHSLTACVPYPSFEPPEQSPALHTANENMCAFLIPLKKGGFWLSAGDATQKDELRIGRWARGEIDQLEVYENAPRVLKISHHGSKTSSAPEFIRMIEPTEAWISDGVGNHYGHPAVSVLEELNALGIPVKRTDETGEIVLREGDDRRRR